MKASLPKGTRDFGPEIVRKRNYIFNTIKNVFELYGFEPLETPAMENLETLTGKYGEEGDKLMFKILNNGLDNPEKKEKAKSDFENILKGKTEKGITERALKYDLTIPFARYVAMNHTKLSFPFKRFQIQPVWRADRPQKGRYREFYQCDADVVGSKSLINEIEFVHIYHDVFSKLGITNYELKINHRKILAALAEQCGGTDKMTNITIAIDKLDKIGLEKVSKELEERGLNQEQIQTIEKYLSITGTNEEKLNAIQSMVGHTENGKAGIEELKYVIQTNMLAKEINIHIDFTLARGLNYYTGIIFEAKAPAEVNIGSIGGGGRYDDLTGLFGVPDIAGVGISFGVDRIYDVLEEMNLFPPDTNEGTQLFFLNLGEEESKKSFMLMQQLRNNGICCELYPEQIKLDKQYKYAEKKNIPYIIVIGSKELAANTCKIKNQKTGTKKSLHQSELINHSF